MKVKRVLSKDPETETFAVVWERENRNENRDRVTRESDLASNPIFDGELVEILTMKRWN